MGTHPIFESDFDCLTEMDTLREINLHLATVEKDLTKSVGKIAMIGGVDDHRQLSQMMAESSQAASDERTRLRQTVAECRTNQHQCNLLIANFDDDGDELAGALEATKNSIFGLKRTSRDQYDQLLHLDETLIREINALLTRVDSFEREKIRVHSPTRGSKSRSNRIGGGDRPEAIQKLHDFQARHGATGGWNGVDHGAFCRMWTRQCDAEHDIWDEEKFIELIEADLPGRSPAAIITHMKFYRQLVKLQRDQKKEIEAWKQARKIAQLTKSTELELIQSETPRKTSQKEAASREKRLKELDAWKQRKADEKREKEAETKQLSARVKQKRLEEKRQQERILKIRELERQNRKEAERLIKEAEKRESEEQRRAQSKEANRALKEVTAAEVYDRQLEITRRRQKEREDKIQIELDKLKRQRRQDQLADFDPTRLYSSTMVQRIRATTTSETKSSSGRSFILHRGGKAPASWRSGL